MYPKRFKADHVTTSKWDLTRFGCRFSLRNKALESVTRLTTSSLQSVVTIRLWPGNARSNHCPSEQRYIDDSMGTFGGSGRWSRRQQHATCTLALACFVVVPIASCVFAASRSNLCRWMLVPGLPDLWQVALVVFIIPANSANTQLSATCAGGLFLSSTCAYTACTYYNLHCVVVVVVVMNKIIPQIFTCWMNNY